MREGTPPPDPARRQVPCSAAPSCSSAHATSSCSSECTEHGASDNDSAGLAELDNLTLPPFVDRETVQGGLFN